MLLFWIRSNVYDFVLVRDGGKETHFFFDLSIFHYTLLSNFLNKRSLVVKTFEQTLTLVVENSSIRSIVCKFT